MIQDEHSVIQTIDRQVQARLGKNILLVVAFDEAGELSVLTAGVKPEGLAESKRAIRMAITEWFGDEGEQQ